jgi:hypothetical protein
MAPPWKAQVVVGPASWEQVGTGAPRLPWWFEGNGLFKYGSSPVSVMVFVRMKVQAYP